MGVCGCPPTRRCRGIQIVTPDDAAEAQVLLRCSDRDARGRRRSGWIDGFDNGRSDHHAGNAGVDDSLERCESFCAPALCADGRVLCCGVVFEYWEPWEVFCDCRDSRGLDAVNEGRCDASDFRMRQVECACAGLAVATSAPTRGASSGIRLGRSFTSALILALLTLPRAVIRLTARAW